MRRPGGLREEGLRPTPRSAGGRRICANWRVGLCDGRSPHSQFSSAEQMLNLSSSML